MAARRKLLRLLLRLRMALYIFRLAIVLLRAVRFSEHPFIILRAGMVAFPLRFLRRAVLRVVCSLSRSAPLDGGLLSRRHLETVPEFLRRGLPLLIQALPLCIQLFIARCKYVPAGRQRILRGVQMIELAYQRRILFVMIHRIFTDPDPPARLSVVLIMHLRHFFLGDLQTAVDLGQLAFNLAELSGVFLILPTQLHLRHVGIIHQIRAFLVMLVCSRLHLLRLMRLALLPQLPGLSGVFKGFLLHHVRAVFHRRDRALAGVQVNAALPRIHDVRLFHSLPLRRILLIVILHGLEVFLAPLKVFQILRVRLEAVEVFGKVGKARVVAVRLQRLQVVVGFLIRAAFTFSVSAGRTLAGKKRKPVLRAARVARRVLVLNVVVRLVDDGIQRFIGIVQTGWIQVDLSASVTAKDVARHRLIQRDGRNADAVGACVARAHLLQQRFPLRVFQVGPSVGKAVEQIIVGICPVGGDLRL